MDWTTLIFGTLLAGLLITVILVDAQTMRIPNFLNVSIAILGLGFLWLESRQAIASHLTLAALVFALLTLLRFTFFLAKGCDGLGQGDVKLFCASALWISIWNFPTMMAMASLSALVYICSRVGFSGLPTFEERLPFGPFIAISLFTTWVWQEV